jgi:hypothetical protein
MKKAYLILFTSFVAAASFGQSLQRIVFNSTGGYIGNPGSVQMLLSVGEPIIGVSGTQDAYLAQGFLGGSKTVAATTTGINETSADNASVYPNPFSNQVQIKSDIANIHVSVYNTLGQEVYTGMYNNEPIDLSRLTPGMYIMQATANEKIISNTKLLKQ